MFLIYYANYTQVTARTFPYSMELSVRRGDRRLTHAVSTFSPL